MREVRETLYDDLVLHQSGGGEKVEAAETVEFSVNGEAFTIDLTADNAALFEEIIKPFRDAAAPAPKKTSPKGKAKAAPSAPASSAPAAASPKKTGTKGVDEESQRIRAWARENGFDLSSRGRLPQEVRDAYAAAQSGARPGDVTHDSLTDAVPPDHPPLNFNPIGDEDPDDSDSTGDASSAPTEGGAAPEPERV
jgi:pyruvate/2-oxoglutarate dehydrogenase complex dihydrolipoamide acyltransferase (E2) component